MKDSLYPRPEQNMPQDIQVDRPRDPCVAVYTPTENRNAAGVLSDAYTGYCKACDRHHTLPRDTAAVDAAHQLMAAFNQQGAPSDIPKMYGVLVGLNAEGETVTLKAYSGMINHRRELPGWVPAPTLPPSLIAEERRAINQLDGFTTSLKTLAANIEEAKTQLSHLKETYQTQIDIMKATIKLAKAERAQQRKLIIGTDGAEEKLYHLDNESQDANRALRRLRVEYRDRRVPIEARLEDSIVRQRELRSVRRNISRALQKKMHVAFRLTNFRGDAQVPIEDGHFEAAPPSGTGECAAPKLLNYAAQNGIKPTGLAEFWWNPAGLASAKEHRSFYGPCSERCQPIMGHLLCGLDAFRPFVPSGSAPLGPLTILYEDEAILVVNKPSGLLSVPGRRLTTADNVITRLAAMRPSHPAPQTAHRLDMATSGVLIVAKTPQAHQNVSIQFQERTVAKTYLARLEREPAQKSGSIRLPLRITRQARPRSIVDLASGKHALTHFRVISDDAHPLVEFTPITGRTHQLRVHAASAEGLNSPILGDPLYGTQPHVRLCLHAHRIEFEHPVSGERMHFCSQPDFG